MDSVEHLLAAVKSLVAIESTAGNPAGLQAAYEFMREMVQANSKAVTIEEFEQGGRPSLLAYRGPERPDKFRIILNAHVDVVPGKPEQYNAVVRDGKLYGRGVYDMKAAAVILARVFCEYVDKVPYALGLQIVTDEESAGKHGTLYQVQQGVRADFVIAGDCGRPEGTHQIANEAKGIVMADVSFTGRGAHGAYPWKGDNAAAKAAAFAHAIHARHPAPKMAVGDTTMTVTSIVAGSDAPNKIADQATVTVDTRFPAGDRRFATQARYAQYIRRFHPEAIVSHYHGFAAPFYTDPRDPLLLELKAAAEEIERAPFSFVRQNGTSDGRFYGDVGNQACEFGLAGEHQHGDDEHVTLAAFENYLWTMQSFLQRTMLATDTQPHELLQSI